MTRLSVMALLGRWLAVMLAAMLALTAAGAQAQIPVAGIIEARGVAAPAALSFKNGYLMGIDEVNAGGGVLGQRLVLTQFDIDTSPEAAAEAAQKAVAGKPFAIFGPQFSGITAVAMKYSAPAAIPHFTSGEAASLTRKFHPSLLRTSLSQAGSAPRLGALVSYGLGAKKVGLLWIENDFGRDGRALLNDVLLLYTTETESIEALKELKKQGFDKPIVADGLVASQKVIEGALGAAEGVLVHMNTSADAPNPQMQAFVKRFEARYKARPDINAIKGFFAVQMLKAGLEVAGKLDQALFLQAMRNTLFDAKSFPELLGSVSYDFFGDLTRASYFAVIQQGRPQILASVRLTEGGMVGLPDGRLITLDSAEFRRELSLGMKGDVLPVKAKP